MTSSLLPVQRYALRLHETILKGACESVDHAVGRTGGVSGWTEAGVEDDEEQAEEERERKKRRWEEARLVEAWREERFGDGFDEEEFLLTYDSDINRGFVDNQGETGRQTDIKLLVVRAMIGITTVSLFLMRENEGMTFVANEYLQHKRSRFSW